VAFSERRARGTVSFEAPDIGYNGRPRMMGENFSQRRDVGGSNGYTLKDISTRAHGPRSTH
jgi:hypothetical protein